MKIITMFSCSHSISVCQVLGLVLVLDCLVLGLGIGLAR